jgi:aspartate carbamoyltransferase catalytic subunit
MKHILPDVDESRVYTSDIKKLISWYKIIRTNAPEVLEDTEDKKEEKES